MLFSLKRKYTRGRRFPDRQASLAAWQVYALLPPMATSPAKSLSRSPWREGILASYDVMGGLRIPQLKPRDTFFQETFFFACFRKPLCFAA